jgi:hypothetical protein
MLPTQLLELELSWGRQQTHAALAGALALIRSMGPLTSLCIYLLTIMPSQVTDVKK